jgi:hypothetical protein
MSELTREEKIGKIITGLLSFKPYSESGKVISHAERILDEIEPPEIKPGMWGRFGTKTGKGVVYGELTQISYGNKNAFVAPYENTTSEWYYSFTPIPGLKEAIEKLEIKLEEK